MRIRLCGEQAAGQLAGQLLAIGDGKVITDNGTTDVIQLPETMDTFVRR